MKSKKRVLYIVALTTGIAVAQYSAHAAGSLMPYHHQSLKHNCESRYVGSGVIDPAGEVLLCSSNAKGGQGWVLAPSSFIQSGLKKCSKVNQEVAISGVLYRCLKFSDGLRSVKKKATAPLDSHSTPLPSAASTISPSDTSSLSPSPLPATPTGASSTQTPLSTPTSTPTHIPGSGAGGGTGGGNGAGKSGASPTP